MSTTRTAASMISKTELKQKLGETCCNCGTNVDIEYHHIVPLSLGGNDIISNIAPICYKCHTLIHHGTTSIISHSESIKAGIKKAQQNGTHCGRAKVTYETIPIEFKEKYYPLIITNQITKAEAARQCVLSRPTVYKYMTIIEEHLRGEI